MKLGGPFDPKFQVEGGVPHQPFYVSEKLHDVTFIRYKNLGGTFLRFVTIHACDGQTDRQRDRQTQRHLCRRKDRVAYMQRGKNQINFLLVLPIGLNFCIPVNGDKMHSSGIQNFEFLPRKNMAPSGGLETG